MARGQLRGFLWALVVCLCTLLHRAWALVDEAADTKQPATQNNNIVVAANDPQDDVTSAFNGDTDRFSRQTAGDGFLLYRIEPGFDSAVLSVYVLPTTAAGPWQLEVFVGKKAVLALTAQQLQQELNTSPVRSLLTQE